MKGHRPGWKREGKVSVGQGQLLGMRGEEHGPTWPNLGRLGSSLAVLGLKLVEHKMTWAELGPNLRRARATWAKLRPNWVPTCATWHIWAQVRSGLTWRNLVLCGGATAQVGPKTGPMSEHGAASQKKGWKQQWKRMACRVGRSLGPAQLGRLDPTWA